MSDWRLEIRDASSFSTVKATLDPTDGSRVFAPKWRHPYRGLGSGQFSLQNDDPDYDNIAEGDLVICLKGSTAVFGWIVQRKLRHSVAKAAAAGVPSGEKFTEFSGQSLKACGARSPVRAKNGGRFRPKETLRPFDWTAVEFDFSAWAAAEQIKRVDEVSAHWKGTPQFVPDPTIYWIGEAGATDDDADSGVRLARAPMFTIDNDDTIVTVFAWIDNEGIFYLNGVEIMRIDTFHECRYVDLLLPAGDYWLAGFGRNLEDTPLSTGANPFAFGFGVYERTSDGAFVSTILVSDSSTKILALPATTPGLPLGAAPRILHEEAQARGEIPGLGLNFTDTTSTNSASFPTAVDAAAVVKETYSDYLLALEDAVVDVEVNPATFEVELYYPRGSRGSASGVTFTDGVSLRKLDHEIRDDRVTKLLIDYDGGYLEHGTGEFCKAVSWSQVSSEDGADRIATEVLAGRGSLSTRFAADIHTDTGREPYEDFTVGDTVTVDDVDGSGAEALVQALTFAVDAAGRIVWGAEFGDPLEPLDTVANRAVRKLVATRSATNVQNSLPSTQGAGGQVYQQQIHEFSYEPSDLKIAQKAEAKATRDLAYLSVVMDDIDTEDHDFVVKVNGVALTDLTVTITAGNVEGKSWADIGEYRVFAGEGGDKITLEFSGGPIRFTAKLAYR